MSESWLGVSARFTWKGEKRSGPGLRGEHWNFGKDKPISLSDLVLGFADAAVRFCYGSGLLGHEEVNQELDKLRKVLSGWRYEEENDDAER